MGWRTVVVSKPSKLDLRLGYMVVRDVESNVQVHISEISVLIIENTASSITTALLCELTKQKIKVIFCDEKQNPSSELVSYYGCHDCSLKFKNKVCFISNFFDLSFSIPTLKKLYEDLSSYSNNFLQDYVVTLKKDILDFLKKLSTEYDFDFSFDDDTDLVDIFKAHNFKPNVDSDDLLTWLLDFIVLTNKYCSFEAYVLLNFHCYFDEEEIEKIYDALKYQGIEILIIESQNSFHSLPQENLYILDKDMCEIVEERWFLDYNITTLWCYPVNCSVAAYSHLRFESSVIS